MHLVADTTPLEILAYLTEPVEIRDPEGCLIGRFTPADPDRAKALYARTITIDVSEIDRRKVPGRKSYSTRQVFEHLKTLTRDKSIQDYLQRKIENLAERDGCATP